MSDMAITLDEEEAILLLVDDRPQNLLALEAVLEPLGHRLLTATSGEEALRHLLTEDVAVILLDVQMPGMDGFETARQIKERKRTSDIPILFLTAEASEMEMAMRGFSSGAVDYLRKPVDEWMLRAKVQVFVDLALKTRVLRRQSEMLAHRLDEQYAIEAHHLRKLADAAIIINSSLSLNEMLEVINESAREIIGAHEAETVITIAGGRDELAHTRSHSAKYAAWAAEGRTIDLTPIYTMVWAENQPVRMTKKEIETSLSARGLFGAMPGHPLLRGWLAVPIINQDGRSLGLIQVADKVEGEFTETDESVLTQLAQLAAVAIGNAERYEQEHRIAEILQRSLLPEALPTVPGLQMAAHYQAGGRGTQVGGDWYDVFSMGDGRVALVLGDVAGHGLRAAAVMGQLRTALRAYAVQAESPADVMAELDTFLQEVNEGAIATVVLLVIDRASSTMEIVSAGHLPPLVVQPDGTSAYVQAEPHPPLGVVAKPSYSITTEDVTNSSILVLYSDGLVEERGEPLDEGLRRLAAAVDTSLGDLDALCQKLVETMAPNGKDDDVTVLAVCLDDIGG